MRWKMEEVKVDYLEGSSFVLIQVETESKKPVVRETICPVSSWLRLAGYLVGSMTPRHLLFDDSRSLVSVIRPPFP